MIKKTILFGALCISFFLIESCGGGHSTVRIGVSVPGPYHGSPYGRSNMYGRPSGGRYYPNMDIMKSRDFVRSSENKTELEKNKN